MEDAGLNRMIEKMRKQLNTMYDTYGDLNDQRIVTYSQRLDRFLVMAQGGRK